MNPYFIYDLVTKTQSKRSWKTYAGAAKHATPTSLIVTKMGIEWMQRHPEWEVSRLNEYIRFTRQKEASSYE